ncbi:modulator of macroautophagy TMEM150B [Kryptolebias marmoratus]|uniref:modulator of macroautophagy TMEM150B n=1 Tax=Kryptolebias marmoratus TaxID=37003 RepID=UPI0018AC9642|nr:modulator of macroautophagy TMEM150B [Kryptolebias marmoratus]
MWKFAILPVFLAVFGIGGIWTVFAVSVINGSVNLTKGMPYISECAGHPPQSCLFAQTCNILSVLITCVVVIRFQQAKDFGYEGRANVAGLWMGSISAVGLSLTSNIQASVSLEIHCFGAVVAFVPGLAYFWVQMYLTYKAQPSVDRPWVGPIRFILCVLCSAFLGSMSVNCVHVLFLDFSFPVCFFNLWYESAGATSEWLAVVVFFLLFGLFAAEFRHVDYCRLTVQRPALESDCCAGSVETNSCAI